MIVNTKTLQENWKTLQIENDGETTCNWCAQYRQEKIRTGTEGLGNERTIVDHPNYSIVEIGQNTKKSLEDLLSIRLQWKTMM